MLCPKCGTEMMKHVYHYEWETVEEYICPKCHYMEYHHYPRIEKLRRERPRWTHELRRVGIWR